MIRRLLAVALVVGGLIAWGAWGAGSAAVAAQPGRAHCPASRSSLGEEAKAAYAVFSGTVTSRHRTGGGRTLEVDVDRIYKGRGLESHVTVSTPTSPARCGLRVGGGDPYVFFVGRDGGRLVTDSRSGTAPASAARVRRVEGLLGNGSSPTPPKATEATFTRLADRSTSVERVVAPGLALVIVGLLGLVLVAAWGRRRA